MNETPMTRPGRTRVGAGFEPIGRRLNESFVHMAEAYSPAGVKREGECGPCPLGYEAASFN